MTELQNFDPLDTITFVSNTNNHFVISSYIAKKSKKIREMLINSENEFINLGCDNEVVEIIISYLYYKAIYDQKPNRPPFHIDPELVLTVLEIANKWNL